MFRSSLRCRRNLLSGLVLGLLLGAGAVAQAELRPALTHDDYDSWPSIGGATYSADGKWFAYSVDPAWGDGVLHVAEVDGEQEFSHPRGSSPKFSADGRYLVFQIKESVEAERRKQLAKLQAGKSEQVEAEAEKKAAAEKSRSEQRRRQMIARYRGRRGGRSGSRSRGGDLAIMDLSTGEVEIIEKTRGFRVARKGELLIYHLGDPDKKDAEAEDKQQRPAGRRRGRGRGRGRSGRRPSRDSGEDKAPEATQLVVRELASGEQTRWDAVVSYQLVAEDRWLCLTCSNSPAKKPAKEPEKEPEEEPETSEATEEPAEKASEGEPQAKPPAVVLPPGEKLADGLHAIDLETQTRVELVAGFASFAGFTTDRRHQWLAFSSDVVDKQARAAAKKDEQEKSAKGGSSGDKKADKLRSDLYLWDFGSDLARRIITHSTTGLPADSVIQSSGLSFCDDGSVLGFGIKAAPPAELPKILPDQKVVVDIWNWRDGVIQPAQSKQASRSKNPTRSCVWHVDDDRVVVLGNERTPSVRMITRDGSRGLVSDSRDYEQLTSWDGRYSDVYLVNTIDGGRRKLRSKARTRVEASPAGRWLVYFGSDYQWYVIDPESLEQRCLTGNLGVPFQNELEDRPQQASAYGVAGWTRDDREVVVNDRYDLWKIDVASGAATCLTDGYGRANNLVLRYRRFDLEGDDDDLDVMLRDYLPEQILLTARNNGTKTQGYFTDSTVAVQRPKRLVMLDSAVGGLTRAKHADRLFFTLSSFEHFPDLWTSDLQFGDRRRLTDACPRQRERRWGKAELVSWFNDDGVALQGILVKPDGFDPERKYPMMVYFYERNSNNLHRYTAPKPGTSPNAAYYVSNGYLWFVPDIVYTVGYPGESAEKCVVSGVQHLIARGFVDVDAIGMAGHSWGGYQTAHLVTRTKLFAAAESGAPVSNMFSAYGGIRYQSGVSRQFQYEHTQSRIGGTPWQYPQRYWQNSPLFYADRVETPVLMLHNDGDGAVPWTNGIEFFMALRRLGREAYLFNYNDEGHGLRKRQNQKDWARRMAEFFDHHLKGAPAPAWMREGVRFIDRAREKIQYIPPVRAEPASSGPSSGTRPVGGG